MPKPKSKPKRYPLKSTDTRRDNYLDLRSRVIARTTVNGMDCWEYHGLRKKGYGSIIVSTHRLMYELDVGPVPPGKQLDHICHNRMCCNPAPLEPVTNAENANRAARLRAQQGVRIRLGRTKCPQGHLYDGDNLYIDKKGMKVCKACRNASSKRNYERIKRLKTLARNQALSP